jgi:predicted nucleic acid-binding protein
LSTLVIDSWALLEWLLGEPGTPRVRTIIDQATGGQQQLLMSWIIVGEVIYMLVQKRRTADDFVRAARIKSRHKLSYAMHSPWTWRFRSRRVLSLGIPRSPRSASSR